MIAVAPEKFAERARGNTDAILAKVAELAKAKGVTHDTVSKITDYPYVAIVNTAVESDCDLIFMASHGRRGVSGMLRGSQTEKVLHHSPIAVCVAVVESNAKQAG